MKKKYVLFFSLLLAFLFSLSTPALAAESSFSVQAVIPKNQLDKSQTYFDLRMRPGESQDLSVEMRNDGSKAVTVNVSPSTAITNQNGIVEYSSAGKYTRDKSLKTAFTDIATTAKEVTVPAKSRKEIKVHIQMPKEEFSGTLLGGINFSEKPNSKDKEASKDSQIINKYAYVIGVKLTEKDTEVKPELRLNDVRAAQVNYRNVITANIQNYKAGILKDLKIEGEIYSKGKDEVLYSASKEKLRMAPNSNFDYAISLGTKPFKPGKYTFKGIAKSGEREWKFEKDFEIKSSESRKYNKESVSLERDYTWLYILIAGLFIFILLLVILILSRKLKKSQNSSIGND